MSFSVNSTIASFGGKLLKLNHSSKILGCKMDANLYLPADIDSSKPIPLLIWLSGLTCTPNNCTEKGFFQRWASQNKIAILYPDTSPRGKEIPDDEAYDFGQGAGFYLTATQEPWNKSFNMYDYLLKELIPDVFTQYSQLDRSRMSISGHSMGGHGALILFLKNPGLFKSVSAFSPILNPTKVPWGEKAFRGYLGDDESTWKKYDALELIQQYSGPNPEILIDIGTSDNFLHQLSPEEFVKAAENSPFKGKVQLRMQPGYDHSYFFVSSFAEDHVTHHAKYLV